MQYEIKSNVPVCYYNVSYKFQSESTLCNLPECQGTPYSKQAAYVKFNDINGIRIHNYLIRKQTLNHLANLAK